MDFDQKPHYRFVGWSEDTNDRIIDENYIITDNLKLKAIWTPEQYPVQVFVIDNSGNTIETVYTKSPIGKSEIILPTIDGYDAPGAKEIEITEEIIQSGKPITLKVECQKKIGSIEVDSNLSIFDSNGIELKSPAKITSDDKIIIAFNDNRDLQEK